MPIAGWIAARTMRLLDRDGGGRPPDAGDGLPPSIASRAELAPAFRRSRRESGRPMVAAHWSTRLPISTSGSPTPHRLPAESPRDYGPRATRAEPALVAAGLGLYGPSRGAHADYRGS